MQDKWTPSSTPLSEHILQGEGGEKYKIYAVSFLDEFKLGLFHFIHCISRSSPLFSYVQIRLVFPCSEVAVDESNVLTHKLLVFTYSR